MRWFAIMALTALTLLALACGQTEVRDRPEDCTDNEYFDEAAERCRLCPAVTEPECLPGCGFEVTEDARQCPALRCDETCPGCDEGEVWNREEESCEPA